MENKITIRPEIKLLHNYKIPTIEVQINDETVGYLAPFRGYRFQVSGTDDGQWDLGSSTVIQYKNIFSKFSEYENRDHKAAIEYFAEILQGAIYESLVKFSNNSYGRGAKLELGTFKTQQCLYNFAVCSAEWIWVRHVKDSHDFTRLESLVEEAKSDIARWSH